MEPQLQRGREHSTAPRAVGMRAFVLLAAAALSALPAGADPASFSRVDAELGIHVVETTYGPTWGDYNGDGYEDVFSTNHDAVPNLLRNHGGTAFEDVFPSGLSSAGDQHGAAWGDMDNDGWPDLYIVCGAPGAVGNAFNHLYRNIHGYYLYNIAHSSGTTDSTGRGRFAYWIDADNDGWLDIFVANKATPNQLFMNQGDLTFLPAPAAGGLDGDDLRLGTFTDLNNDGYLDVLLGDCETARMALFENQGDGTFRDITAQSWLPAGLTFVWSVCWLDYDNDGDQDVYFSRGYWPSRRDCYLLNDAQTELKFQTYMSNLPAQEDGVDGFDLAADASGLRFTMLIDQVWGPNQHIYLGAAGAHPTGNSFLMADGQYLGQPAFVPGVSLGCYIWQDAPGGAWHVRTSTSYNAVHRFWTIVEARDGTFTDIGTQDLETTFVDDDLGDRLYRNRGNGRFDNVTAEAGIGDNLSGKNCVAADFDNDGWVDLYVVNDRETSGLLARHAPSLLYMNNGDGTFSEGAAEAGVECVVEGTGAGAGWADYDRDGFADLFVTNGWGNYPFHEGEHVVYRNNGNGNHWVGFRLVGVASNRDAVGARVRIESRGQAQYRVHAGAVIDMSQSSQQLLFGLGTAAVVDSVTIWWPSGIVRTYADLLADQYYVLEEGEGAGVAEPRPACRLLLSATPNPTPQGARVSYWLASGAPVRLAVVDVTGHRVRLLDDAARAAGRHEILWDGRDQVGRPVGSGVYWLRLRAGDAAAEQRVTVIR